MALNERERKKDVLCRRVSLGEWWWEEWVGGIEKGHNIQKRRIEKKVSLEINVFLRKTLFRLDRVWERRRYF